MPPSRRRQRHHLTKQQQQKLAEKPLPRISIDAAKGSGGEDSDGFVDEPDSDEGGAVAAFLADRPVSRRSSLRRLWNIGANAMAQVTSGQEAPLTAFGNAASEAGEELRVGAGAAASYLSPTLERTFSGSGGGGSLRRGNSIVRITSSDPTSRLSRAPIHLELQPGGGLAHVDKTAGTQATPTALRMGLAVAGNGDDDVLAPLKADGTPRVDGSDSISPMHTPPKTASPVLAAADGAASNRPGSRRRRESGRLTSPSQREVDAEQSDSLSPPPLPADVTASADEDVWPSGEPAEESAADRSNTSTSSHEGPHSKRRGASPSIAVGSASSTLGARRAHRARLAGANAMRKRRSSGSSPGALLAGRDSRSANSDDDLTTETETSDSDAATSTAATPRARRSASHRGAPAPILKRVPEAFKPSALDAAGASRTSLSSADVYAKTSPTSPTSTLAAPFSPLLSPGADPLGLLSPNGSQFWPVKRTRSVKLTEPDWRPYAVFHDRARERMEAAAYAASQLKSASTPNLRQQITSTNMGGLSGLPGLGGGGSESGGSNSSSSGTATSAEEDFWFERFTQSTAAAGKDWDWRKRRQRAYQQLQQQNRAAMHANASAAAAAAWQQVMMEHQGGAGQPPMVMQPGINGSPLSSPGLYPNHSGLGDMAGVDGHLQRANRGVTRPPKLARTAPLLAFSQEELASRSLPTPTATSNSPLLNPLPRFPSGPPLSSGTGSISRGSRRAILRSATDPTVPPLPPTPPAKERPTFIVESKQTAGSDLAEKTLRKRTSSSGALRKMIGLKVDTDADSLASGAERPRRASTSEADASHLSVPNRFSSLKPKGKPQTNGKKSSVNQLLAEADAFVDDDSNEEEDSPFALQSGGLTRGMAGNGEESPSIYSGPPAGAWGGRRPNNSSTASLVESQLPPRSSADMYGSGAAPREASAAGSRVVSEPVVKNGSSLPRAPPSPVEDDGIAPVSRRRHASQPPGAAVFAKNLDTLNGGARKATNYADLTSD